MEEYDLVVLGSGTGGKILAGTFAQKGQRVIAIERKYVAGSCPNIACLPSKNIIHSAKVASFFYRSNEFGISKENVRINMAAVRERKRKMVRNLADIFLEVYKQSSAAASPPSAPLSDAARARAQLHASSAEAVRHTSGEACPFSLLPKQGCGTSPRGASSLWPNKGSCWSRSGNKVPQERHFVVIEVG